MTTAFERHGIAHLSASSLNLYAAEPALWVMERLLGKRGKVGAAAHRGSASEAGITHGLLNPEASIEDCQAIAVKEYDRLTALSGDPKRETERAAVPGIVKTGLAELRQYGVPDMVQTRVDLVLPGVSVPLVGYLDFGWSQHGLIVDLKTQLKLTSQITPSHARQVALYIHGRNQEARVAYTTPAKIGVYRLESADEHIHALTCIAQRLERLLAISADPAEITAIMVPNYDAFYWSDPHTRATGREVFGF